MSFSTRNIPENDTFIKLNNVNLSFLRIVKYLGALLNESLKFKQHIRMTGDTISQNIGILTEFRRVHPKTY